MNNLLHVLRQVLLRFHIPDPAGRFRNPSWGSAVMSTQGHCISVTLIVSWHGIQSIDSRSMILQLNYESIIHIDRIRHR